MNVNLSSPRSPDFFKLLGHEVRWSILTLLARSDYCNQELTSLLKHPQNLLSYHIGLLRELGLVTERRSAADERTIYYRLNLDTFRSLYFSSADALHPAFDQTGVVQQEMISSLPHKSVRVLFLCTHNSARSQMAEGILRHLSNGRIEALSAGSQPLAVHPLAVQALTALGIDISQQQPKHLDQMKHLSFDYIVTVCDRVRESCPTFPDDPERIHWSIPDPVVVEGSKKEQYRAFEQVALELMTRIRYLVILIDRENA
ncbi:MAG TPA: ArsR family transcriptional regulator [Ktedonobacteraceae bacterium]|nr:ArsR family transcriptional regulator [Ktedonobacteraceae bacterium]